jgi:hypothetical protein
MNREQMSMKRYELWADLCQLAEHVQRIADEWWDLDDEVQALHYDRCNLGQLTLYEPDAPRKRSGENDT